LNALLISSPFPSVSPSLRLSLPRVGRLLTPVVSCVLFLSDGAEDDDKGGGEGGNVAAFVGGPTLVLDQKLRTERTEEEEEEGGGEKGGREEGKEGGASEEIGYVKWDLVDCLLVSFDLIVRIF